MSAVNNNKYNVRAKSLADVKDNYVKVDAKDSIPDTKDTTTTASLQTRAINALKSGGAKGKIKTIRTKLAYHTAFTEVNGAPVFDVTSIDATNSSEFASFASLFDQYFVHGGWLFFRVVNTGSNAVGTMGAYSYDPDVSAPFTTIEDVLVASQNLAQ